MNADSCQKIRWRRESNFLEKLNVSSSSNKEKWSFFSLSLIFINYLTKETDPKEREVTKEEGRRNKDERVYVCGSAIHII